MNAHQTDYRPGPDTITGRVWAIADRVFRDPTRGSRKKVIEASVAEGIRLNTASTAFHLWKQHSSGPGSDRAPTPAGNALQVTLQIAADGRLVIPADFRAKMKLGDDGKVLARIEDGELRLISHKMALEKLQAIIAEHDHGKGSPIDELLAERRAESRE